MSLLGSHWKGTQVVKRSSWKGDRSVRGAWVRLPFLPLKRFIMKLNFDELKKGIVNDYNKIINKPNKTKGEIDFINKIQHILEDEKSKKIYMEKNKNQELLKYDTETFMPIYRGVEKWKSCK